MGSQSRLELSDTASLRLQNVIWSLRQQQTCSSGRARSAMVGSASPSGRASARNWMSIPNWVPQSPCNHVPAMNQTEAWCRAAVQKLLSAQSHCKHVIRHHSPPVPGGSFVCGEQQQHFLNITQPGSNCAKRLLWGSVNWQQPTMPQHRRQGMVTLLRGLLQCSQCQGVIQRLDPRNSTAQIHAYAANSVQVAERGQVMAQVMLMPTAC